MPHTDSDFLTILLQYNVGGLQLVKDGKWIAVKPNPDALIINIGDLFQVSLHLPFIFVVFHLSFFFKKKKKRVKLKLNCTVIFDGHYCLYNQAWSNDVYKSVEHRVVTNAHVERFSTAYFLCPSYDTVLDNGFEPSVYRKFSFREYRKQVQDDVTKLGFKIGLPRFLKPIR